ASNRRKPLLLQLRCDGVLAGRQTEDSVLTDIVRAGETASARRDQSLLPLLELESHERDRDRGRRIPELIRDAAGNHRAPRKGNIDIVERLTVREHEGLSRARRLSLSVGPAHENIL